MLLNGKIHECVAAIPPPRFHLLRFHGVLAPHSTLRPRVVPKPKSVVDGPHQLPLFAQLPDDAPTAATSAPGRDALYAGRHAWAVLLRHVFATDVTVCVHCQGRLCLRELCTKAEPIARAMARVGLAPQPPPRPASPRYKQPLQGLLELG